MKNSEAKQRSAQQFLCYSGGILSIYLTRTIWVVIPHLLVYLFLRTRLGKEHKAIQRKESPDR